MPDFQLLGCHIVLAGSPQKETIVVRGAHNPVTYPELLVLQFLHGDDAVTDIMEVGTLSKANNDHLQDLYLNYPTEAVRQCFPGARPALPSRNDEYPKSREVLMAAQEARDAKTKAKVDAGKPA